MKYFIIAVFAALSVPVFAQAASMPVVTIYASAGSSTSSIVMSAVPVSPASSPSVCPLLTDFLKKGGPNNPQQVARLQTFLRDSLKLDVTVNGIFDAKTEAAVKAFQTTYASEIMTPWGATAPSGFVHITTQKKINQLACKQALSLSADELKTINEFKARGAGASGTNSTASSSAGAAIVVQPATVTDTAVDYSSSTRDTLMKRFGQYIVNLFK